MESLVVPKRKIPVRIHTIDSDTITGQFYAALQTVKGTPEGVVDRLNDPREKYVPVAMEGKHVLVKKASIVMVEVDESARDREKQTAHGITEHRLEVRMSEGSKVHGLVKAWMEPARSRALDLLNSSVPTFIEVLSEKRIVIINGDHIVAVSEVFDS